MTLNARLIDARQTVGEQRLKPSLKIALCHAQVMPARGGCGTYIADLAHRLVNDGHEVHLYGCEWDQEALPTEMRYHPLPQPLGPRFWRPWQFARQCEEALKNGDHDVSVGFDKTYGQDILYPQGGLHRASVSHNMHKYKNPLMRALARVGKWFELAHWTYSLLEKQQYLGEKPPLVLVNSYMVRRHFALHYGVPPENLRMIRSAIDPNRFPEHDRAERRRDWREKWQIRPEETVGLIAAMNYRLKGLEPLLYAVRELVRRPDYDTLKSPFRLVVAGNAKFSRWQRLARRLGIADCVTFVGQCNEMRDAYFAADFLVHPTFYDPCSLVVLEAMSCGLPVITTRANGASELMRQLEEGYVIDDPHDHKQLSWCLWQLLDPDRRHSCSEAARQTASLWTFEDHYQQILQVFRRVARKRAVIQNCGVL